jgi:hypothetical protein
MAEQKPKTFIPLYGTFAASAFSACWAEVRRAGGRDYDFTYRLLMY